MEIEQALQKVTDFTRLNLWRAEKYGRKYADMDMAEQIAKEEEQRQQLIINPTLFDTQND
jgi:hypothetical protein